MRHVIAGIGHDCSMKSWITGPLIKVKILKTLKFFLKASGEFCRCSWGSWVLITLFCRSFPCLKTVSLDVRIHFWTWGDCVCICTALRGNWRGIVPSLHWSGNGVEILDFCMKLVTGFSCTFFLMGSEIYFRIFFPILFSVPHFFLSLTSFLQALMISLLLNVNKCSGVCWTAFLI